MRMRNPVRQEHLVLCGIFTGRHAQAPASTTAKIPDIGCSAHFETQRILLHKKNLTDRMSGGDMCPL